MSSVLECVPEDNMNIWQGVRENQTHVQGTSPITELFLHPVKGVTRVNR